MTIHITPIPALYDFATPSITLGAAAAPGSAPTVIRSDSTIAGIAPVASTTDESIARYNGTGGQLQGYSSNPPTISDAGVMTLASGQLTFPATQNASTNANTLDDYEEGTFTPYFSDSSGGTGTGQTYIYQFGNYVKIGIMVWFQLRCAFNNNLGGLSGDVYVKGLPFTSKNQANNWQATTVGNGSGWSITSGESGAGYINSNSTLININLWDGALGSSGLQFSELTADGGMTVSGCYMAAA